MRMGHIPQNLLEHRREEKQVGELRIELRSTPCGDRLRPNVRCSRGAIPATVGDGIEGIADRYEPGRQWDASATETARIATAVPSLMVREDAFAQLGIERREGLEHIGATLRMRRDRPPFPGRELRWVVDDVDQRLVDFPNVVKEGDALNVSARRLLELRRTRERQRV